MADFKTISLADQVFEKLENDIIIGVYPRGEILTELKLVEQLGVSRTPIRDALRRLEQERLIEDSGKGSVVLGITVEDLMDIMNIRQHVEGLASYHAAKHQDAESIKKLEHIIELHDFYADKHDIENMRKLDDEFHDTLSEMSQRNVIKDTLAPLHRKTRRYRKLSIGNENRLVHCVEEHKAIYEAVAAGDADLAYDKTALHILNAKKNLMERLHYNG